MAEQTFKQLRKARLQGTGFKPLNRPGIQPVCNRKGVALGVLIQPRGQTPQSVGYLSKKADVWLRAGPPAMGSGSRCSPVGSQRQLAHLAVYTPHMVVPLLNTRGGLWFLGNQLRRYEALLLEGLAVQIRTCFVLNPALFLTEENGEPLHGST